MIKLKIKSAILARENEPELQTLLMDVILKVFFKYVNERLSQKERVVTIKASNGDLINDP